MCEYCDEDGDIEYLINDSKSSVMVFVDVDGLAVEDESGLGVIGRCSINYCPMCGNNLGG